MSGFNLKGLLPPCSLAKASRSTPQADLQPRKRKAPAPGASSQPEPPIDLVDFGRDTPLSEVVPPNQPRMTFLGNVLDPNVPSQGSSIARTSIPQAWAPTYDFFGEPIKSNAAILLVGMVWGPKWPAHCAKWPASPWIWKSGEDQPIKRS